MKKKVYTISVEEGDGRATMNRVNDGFTAIELLGLMQFIKEEILLQMQDKIKPDIVTRTVIKEQKNEG